MSRRKWGNFTKLGCHVLTALMPGRWPHSNDEMAHRCSVTWNGYDCCRNCLAAWEIHGAQPNHCKGCSCINAAHAYALSIPFAVAFSASFNLRILSKCCSLPALFLCPLDLTCTFHSLPSSIIMGREGSSVHISQICLRWTLNDSEGLKHRMNKSASNTLRERFETYRRDDLWGCRSSAARSDNTRGSGMLSSWFERNTGLIYLK